MEALCESDGHIQGYGREYPSTYRSAGRGLACELLLSHCFYYRSGTRKRRILLQGGGREGWVKVRRTNKDPYLSIHTPHARFCTAIMEPPRSTIVRVRSTSVVDVSRARASIHRSDPNSTCTYTCRQIDHLREKQAAVEAHLLARTPVVWDPVAVKGAVQRYFSDLGLPGQYFAQTQIQAIAKHVESLQGALGGSGFRIRPAHYPIFDLPQLRRRLPAQVANNLKWSCSKRSQRRPSLLHAASLQW